MKDKNIASGTSWRGHNRVKRLYHVVNRIQFTLYILVPMPLYVRDLMFHKLDFTQFGWGDGMRRKISGAEKRLESFGLRFINRCEVLVAIATQLLYRLLLCLAEAKSYVTALERLSFGCGNHG